MRKFNNILGSFVAVMSVISGAFSATGVAASRVATNADHARAVGTVPGGQGNTSGARTKQSANVQKNTPVSRSAKNVVKRSSVSPNRAATTVSSISRTSDMISHAGNELVNRALGMSRSAKPVTTKSNSSGARSATNHSARSAVQVGGGASRSRATAVFSDTTKLGDGYNNCREAYNTCMDQFCAGANETYRRCYCSNTYKDLRNKEDALDAATLMLAQFENNNLTAVTLSAEEVNAMYTATAGEAAIKNDTSGAAALLNDISDLLSGKKTVSQTTNTTSLTGLTIDFSSDFSDIFNTDSNSLFGNGTTTDLSTMDGVDLYNNAHNECMQLVGSVCEAGAVRNMAKSAYSILITQDCNAYQKKVDAKTEQIQTTVRTAEKYLREARLEEYRSHNSSDVNECMDRVEAAITQSTACGADYVKCLDYSGVYINSTSGEPIYSPRLFGLNEIITLDGSADVLAQNPQFNQFLDSKRVYAQSALDTCRDLADTVWSEFKRNALIKISQAQDEKIEEVKMSCVSTMKDCYDTQSDALKSFDDTTAQASGALAARASRDMCSDKVLACAALYSRDGAEVCKVDSRGKITNASTCGLASLVNFVDTVDDVRIAEGCSTAVDSYLKQICTPSTGTEGYPWNCRLREIGNLNEGENWSKTAVSNNMTLAQMIKNYAIENCVGSDAQSLPASESRIQADIVQQFSNLQEELGDQLAGKCEETKGIWFDANMSGIEDLTPLTAFYSNVFGSAYDDVALETLGKCVENTTMVKCLSYNTDSTIYASYDSNTDSCNFTDDWYGMKCTSLGGTWESPVCYIQKQ